MRAIVVYESLWGNTAAIARAVGEGLGDGTKVMTTSEATPSMVAAADLVVAGAPIHAVGLPSADSRESARTRPPGMHIGAPDLSHIPMRDWLASLSPTKGAAAAFDTRMGNVFGRGGSTKIAKRLGAAGYRLATPPQGFIVESKQQVPGPGGSLREGELERARAWGGELARLI